MSAIMSPAMAPAAQASSYAISPRDAHDAGFFRRVMASLIDGAIVLTAYVCLMVAIGGAVSMDNDKVMVTRYGKSTPVTELAKPDVVVTRNGAVTTTVETTTANIGLQTVYSVVTRTTTAGVPGFNYSSNVSMVPSALGLALLAGVWLLYGALLECSPLQGTVGKRAMFIRVADEDGKPMGLAQALARNALKWASAIPLFAGFVMAGLTARKQALHDILSRTTVVAR